MANSNTVQEKQFSKLNIVVHVGSSPLQQPVTSDCTGVGSEGQAEDDVPQKQRMKQTSAEEALAVVKKLLSALEIPGDRGRKMFTSTLAPRGLAIHARGRRIEYEDFPNFADQVPWDGGVALVEGLDGEPTVLVDHDVAMVWAPYWFTRDAELSHVGTDIVTLLYRDWFGEGREHWLIISAADTYRQPNDEDKKKHEDRKRKTNMEKHESRF